MCEVRVTGGTLPQEEINAYIDRARENTVANRGPSTLRWTGILWSCVMILGMCRSIGFAALLGT